MCIFVLTLVVTTDDGDTQTGFLEALANRCLFGRLSRFDAPTGKFGVPCERLSSWTFSN
jgi:hypothetical protein